MSTSGIRQSAVRRKTHRILAGALVVLLVLISGFVMWAHFAAQPNVIRKDRVVAVVDGRRFHFGPGGEIGEGVGGALTLIADRCLGLGTEDHGSPLVWPRGSKLRTVDGTVQIQVPGHASFKVGDRIEFGVHFGKRRDLTGLDLPTGCKSRDALVVEEPTLVNPASAPANEARGSFDVHVWR